MPIETVPGLDLRYHLVAFDARGRERHEGDEPHSRAVLRAAADTGPSDVFVLSHGWNADVPAARSQYERWIRAMDACGDDRARLAERPGGYRPLLVALHWPSKAWADERLPDGPPDPTATGPAAVPPGGAPGSAGEVDRLVDRYAAALTDSPSTREALQTVLGSALEDAAPTTLPEEVRRAYRVIDAETSPPGDGPGAAPGDDREAFDPEAAYQAGLQEEVVTFGEVSPGGVLSPLRVLTFWQMKRRARTFGESGAAALLGELQEAAPDARFHLVGHSFGCIVASAAVAGSGTGHGARRPVHTLVLVQGAMSLWSFCSDIPARPDRPGYFRRVLADGLVDGPVLVTTSVHDRAVRVFYPLGAGARRQVDFLPGDDGDGLPAYGAIGTFGVRGPGIETTDDVLRPADTAYGFRPHVVHNLDADDVIRSGDGMSGAHSDICHPQLAHAVWQAVTTPGSCTG